MAYRHGLTQIRATQGHCRDHGEVTHVVTENCIKCKYTDCVEVCPVDCFHEGPNFLVIDPVECIDCTLCVEECPVGAIYPEGDVPAGQEAFLGINAELAPQWPVIDKRIPAPPDADKWDGVPGKLKLLIRQATVPDQGFSAELADSHNKQQENK